jgi:hypothetical protein
MYDRIKTLQVDVPKPEDFIASQMLGLIFGYNVNKIRTKFALFTYPYLLKPKLSAMLDE